MYCHTPSLCEGVIPQNVFERKSPLEKAIDDIYKRFNASPVFINKRFNSSPIIGKKVATITIDEYPEIPVYKLKGVDSIMPPRITYSTSYEALRYAVDPMRSYRVKRIIYNNPATIVFWMDGTKTVVKKAKGEKFNKYTAFCAALAKKMYGNNSRVNAIVASGFDQTVKKEAK